jgi:diacylglycerol kinase (ATP)
MGSPFGPLTLIVNPRAGKGAVERSLDAVREVIDGFEIEYEMHLTEGPGHATELAREAILKGGRFIAAMGGDGTVHEVVNGMMGEHGALDPEAVLAVIPGGTGCDFVKTFGMSQVPQEAARHLEGKNIWGRLDIGRVRYIAPDGLPASRWFINVAEAGIGAAVVKQASKIKRTGAASYRLAALKAAVSFKPQPATLRMNGRKARGLRPDTPLGDATHSARATMVVIANCQFFGGGLRVAPRAIPSDAMMDVLIGEGSKMQAIKALQKMPSGTHVPDATIAEYLADRVALDGPEPLEIEADGELLGRTPAIFDLVPGAITLKI